MANEFILVLFGVSLGAIYALVVLGLVVTYRMTKFLNLAHGAMGMFVTHLHWQMTVEWGLSPFLALPISILVLAPILGIVVGRFLYRPLLSRSDSAKIAGSVAVLTVLFEVVARVWGGRPGELDRTLPRSSFEVANGAFFGWDRVIIILVALGAAIGLGLLLSRTMFGFSVRAVAENRRMAGMFGVNVDRVEAIGWAVATSLAALAGIFISELGTVQSIQLTFLVIAALAAAAIGRLTSITGAMAGAALLGIVQSEMSRLPVDFVERFGSLPAAAPFLILLGSLFVFRQLGLNVGGGRVDQTSATRVQVPPQSGSLSLRRVVTGRRSAAGMAASVRQLVVVAAVAVGAGAIVGSVVSSTWLFVLTTGAIFTVTFASISMLNGLGGQVSLCQASFMGVGALVAARVQQRCIDSEITGRPECTPLDDWWRVWVGLAIGALVAGAVGFIIASVSARVRGVMLAVTTVSFGFFLDQTLFPSRDYAGGEFGFAMQRPAGFEGPVAFFLLVIAFATVSVWFFRNLSTSGSGRVMRLTEQSPMAAEAFGFRGSQYKTAIFTISAAVAGLAGGLYASLLQSFQGLNYSSLVSLVLFLIAYAVGTGRTFGPVVAAIAFVGVPELLGYAATVEDYGNLVFGVGAFVALSLPGGLLGWLAVRRKATASRSKSLRLDVPVPQGASARQ